MNTSLPTTLPGQSLLEGLGAATAGQTVASTGAATATGGSGDFLSLLGSATGSASSVATVKNPPASLPAGLVPSPLAPAVVPGVTPSGEALPEVNDPTCVCTTLTAPSTDQDTANLLSYFSGLVTGLASPTTLTGVATLDPVTGEVTSEEGVASDLTLDRSELEALLALIAPVSSTPWQVVTTQVDLPEDLLNQLPADLQAALTDPKNLAVARQLASFASGLGVASGAGENAGGQTGVAGAADAESGELPFADLPILSAELELANGTRIVLRPGLTSTANSGVANSAASPAERTSAAIESFAAKEKTTQSDAQELIAVSDSKAGIAVAETGTAMPQPVASSSPILVSSPDKVLVGASAIESLEVDAQIAADTPVQAAEIVQAVADVVEAQAASRMQPVPSVTVRFEIGEGQLAVRVELRDGEVRTEFKTDSRELQSALAHEWRAVASTLESGVRLADPVFTTSAKSDVAGQASTGGESFSQSRSSTRSTEEFLAAQSVRSLRNASTAVADEAPVVPLVTRYVPTSQRLSVLA